MVSMNVEQLLQQLLDLQEENQVLVTRNQDLSTQQEKLKKKLSTSEAHQTFLEYEVDVLMRRITLLTRRLAEATRTDQQLALTLEIKHIQQQLDDRNQELFGSKSERRLSAKNQDRAERKKQRGHGPKKQPALPRVSQVHLLDEADV